MADILKILRPTVAPFGFEITQDDIQAVWDVFVKPTQSDDAPPQSIETRILMGVLRAVAYGLGNRDEGERDSMSEHKMRFWGRATGRDPEGYYYPRWDQAQKISVVATSQAEATQVALAALGTHPRFGVSGFGDHRDTPGWAIEWDEFEAVSL